MCVEGGVFVDNTFPICFREEIMQSTLEKLFPRDFMRGAISHLFPFFFFFLILFICKHFQRYYALVFRRCRFMERV